MYDTTKPYLDQIESIIKTTWDTPYVHVDETGIYRKRNLFTPEFHHTDGIGRKGEEHWRHRTFQAAVQDALAMNLNDFCLARAYPTTLCNHLFLPQDDHQAIEKIISYLAAECRMRHIAMTAGETAIHNNMNGMELSITMSGFKRSSRPNKFCEGDMLIGIASSGLHSNGFTKVYELLGDTLPSVLIAPTLIYFDIIGRIDREYNIHGMAHITGGAFTKLKRFLGHHDACIGRNHHLDPHPIFWELLKKGVSEKDMYTIFNCGIGFIFGVSPECVDGCLSMLQPTFKAAVVGNIISGIGKVHIQSKFSHKKFLY